jgi:hypothetical protein
MLQAPPSFGAHPSNNLEGDRTPPPPGGGPSAALSQKKMASSLTAIFDTSKIKPLKNYISLPYEEAAHYRVVNIVFTDHRQFVSFLDT